MLIYISPSKINLKVANTIQSLHMKKSFEKVIKTFTIIQSNKYEETKNTIALKSFGYGFFNNLYFSIRTIISLNLEKKLSNKEENIIYSRNELIILLSYLCGYKKNFLEVHDLRNGSFSYLIIYFLQFTEIVFICINKKLKFDLNKLGISNKKLFVISDAHGNKTNNINEGIMRFNKIKEKIEKKEKLKIGYFGKISRMKGSLLLEDLIKNYHKEIDFYIYAINENKFKGMPCTVKRVSHNLVYEEMKKMDFLLYLSNLDKDNSHSKYTSPLKIYEYISTLRPILYMPAGDLIEELENTFSIPFKNNKEFKIGLSKLLSIKDPYNLIKNTYKISEQNTWERRAEKIIDIINETHQNINL